MFFYSQNEMALRQRLSINTVGAPPIRLDLSSPRRTSSRWSCCAKAICALALIAALLRAAPAALAAVKQRRHGVGAGDGTGAGAGAGAAAALLLRRRQTAGAATTAAATTIAATTTPRRSARRETHELGKAKDLKSYLWSKRSGTRRSWYVIVTFTTVGYLPYAVNLLLHLERHGMLHQAMVLCFDDASHAALVEMGYDPFRYGTDAVSTEHVDEKDGKQLIEFGTVQFGELMKLKLHVMRTILEQKFQFLYIDGDVVLLRNPLQYLLTDMKPYDVVYQHNGAGPCNTGFMFWRPTREALATLSAFYPGGVDEQAWLCRQMQRTISRRRHTSLSKDLFVAGKLWYHDAKRKRLLERASPFAVHYNWRKGEKKQGLMMLHHHWLATPELERATALAVAEGIARLPPNCTTLDVEFVKARRHQLATHIPTGLAPGTELQQQQQQQQRRGSGSSSNASSSARAASNVRGGRKRGQTRH